MKDDTLTEENSKVLPTEITNILDNSDLDDYLFFKLLPKYEIPDDAKMLVVFTTRALLSGDVEPNEFVKIISTTSGLPQEKATLVAQEINRDIFNPVKDALKQLHGVGDKDIIKRSSSPASVPSPYTSQPASAIPTKPIPPTTSPVAVFVLPTPIKTSPLATPPVSVATPQSPTATPLPTPPQKPVSPPAPFGSVPEIPPKMVVPQAPRSIPTPPIAQTTPITPKPNNLEAKLGANFSLKNEVMYTQPGAPLPITPIESRTPTNKFSLPQVPGIAPVVVPTAPIIPPPPKPTSSDPYRETV